MIEKKQTKNIWFALPILFASLYLTFFVDQFTLDTFGQRLLVFVYFCVMAVLAVILKRKKYVSNKKQIVSSLLLSAVIVALFWNTFIPTKTELPITLTALPSETGGGEVWLTEMYIDGVWTPLSELQVSENSGWLYYEEYDDFVYYPPDGQTAENILNFSVVGREAELTFAYNSWSGAVAITDSTENGTTLNLHTTDEGQAAVDYYVTAPSQGITPKYAVLTAGAVVVIVYFLSVLIGTMHAKLDEEKKKRLVFPLLLNALVLFCTSERIAPAKTTLLFLAILSVVSVLVTLRAWGTEEMKRYSTKSGLLILGLISVYASLTSFAQRYFLDGNTRVHFSLPGLCYVILGCVWFFPVIVTLLLLIGRLAQCGNAAPALTHKKRKNISLFLLLAVCQLAVLSAFWPGGFPPDTLEQLDQAVGNVPLNDWHPILHTLYFKLVYTIFGEAGMIVAIQILLFTCLATAILMYGYEKGLPYLFLCLIGVVFVLLPNQILSGIGAVKDYLFTMALLWGTYLLYRLASDLEACKKVWFCVSFFLDIFLVVTLRHNGIVPAIFMVAVAIGITVCRFSQVKLRLLLPSFLAVICIVIFKGPVFTMLGVVPNEVSPYTTMLCAIGSCINKDLPLSEDTLATMETVLPLEEWKEYYSRYYGHDLYIWGRDSEIIYDTSQITAQKAFGAYLEALWKYPDVIIKDRIDGMDIMWDVAQPTDSFNVKIFDRVVNQSNTKSVFEVDKLAVDEWGSYYNNSTVANSYRLTAEVPTNTVSDMLFWRSGAYLIFLLVLCFYWWKNSSKMFLAAVPLFGNIFGSLFLLYHQSFRYVYFIQLLTVALFFLTICENKNREKEDLYGQDSGIDSLLQ